MMGFWSIVESVGNVIAQCHQAKFDTLVPHGEGLLGTEGRKDDALGRESHEALMEVKWHH